MALVLDSGAVSFLAGRTLRAAALIKALQQEGLWPPVVPSPVLIECLQGASGVDANTNRLLKSCVVHEEISEHLVRRAAKLRSVSGRGSAIDALVVVAAEPGGSVLTSDLDDLSALAEHARNVTAMGV